MHENFFTSMECRYEGMKVKGGRKSCMEWIFWVDDIILLRKLITTRYRDKAASLGKQEVVLCRFCLGNDPILRSRAWLLWMRVGRGVPHLSGGLGCRMMASSDTCLQY